MANGNDVDDGRCEDSGGGGRRVGSRPCQCGIRELWKSLYMPVYMYILNGAYAYMYVCVYVHLQTWAQRSVARAAMSGLGQYALALEYDMKIVKKDINGC